MVIGLICRSCLAAQFCHVKFLSLDHCFIENGENVIIFLEIRCITGKYKLKNGAIRCYNNSSEKSSDIFALSEFLCL